MTTRPSDSEPLEALIEHAAHAEALRAQRHAAGSERRPRRRLWFNACLLLVTALALHSVWTSLRPPSTQQTARDLEAVVDAARQSVEEARSQTGQLPAALPNAALASVVRYEPDAGSYRLSATIMGVRVSLEPDGKKLTVTGEVR